MFTAEDGTHRYPFDSHRHPSLVVIDSGSNASQLGDLLDGFNRLLSQDPNIQRCATSKMANGRYRTCDAVYRCVFCSLYRLAERRQGLKAGLADAPDAAFITLTRAHGAGPLVIEWDITEEITTRLTNRSDWSRFKNLHGLDGYAIIVETPVSETGWNVHVHLLVTFDHMLDQQAVEAFAEALTARWCRAAAHVGYVALEPRQTVTMLRTQDDREGAAVYVTKQNLLHLATDTKHGS